MVYHEEKEALKPININVELNRKLITNYRKRNTKTLHATIPLSRLHKIFNTRHVSNFGKI